MPTPTTTSAMRQATDPVPAPNSAASTRCTASTGRATAGSWWPRHARRMGGARRRAGSTELASDPRFAAPAGRVEHDADLGEELTRCFPPRSAGEWERVMVDTDVGVVEVFGGSTADFTNTDPVLVETGLVTHVEHPVFGTILRHAVPVTFSDTSGRVAPAHCWASTPTRCSPSSDTPTTKSTN